MFVLVGWWVVNLRFACLWLCVNWFLLLCGLITFVALLGF